MSNDANNLKKPLRLSKHVYTKSFGNLPKEDFNSNKFLIGNYSNRKLKINKNNKIYSNNRMSNDIKKQYKNEFYNSVGKNNKIYNDFKRKYSSANKFKDNLTFNEFSFNGHFPKNSEINIIQVKNWNTNNNYINSTNNNNYNYNSNNGINCDINNNKKNISKQINLINPDNEENKLIKNCKLYYNNELMSPKLTSNIRLPTDIGSSNYSQRNDNALGKKILLTSKNIDANNSKYLLTENFRKTSKKPYFDNSEIKHQSFMNNSNLNRTEICVKLKNNKINTNINNSNSTNNNISSYNDKHDKNAIIVNNSGYFDRSKEKTCSSKDVNPSNSLCFCNFSNPQCPEELHFSMVEAVLRSKKIERSFENIKEKNN